MPVLLAINNDSPLSSTALMSVKACSLFSVTILRCVPRSKSQMRTEPSSINNDKNCLLALSSKRLTLPALFFI